MRVADAKPGRRYHVEFDAVLQSAAQDGWVEFQDSYGCDVEAQLPPSATLTEVLPEEPSTRLFAIVDTDAGPFIRNGLFRLQPWEGVYDHQQYSWSEIAEAASPDSINLLYGGKWYE